MQGRGEPQCDGLPLLSKPRAQPSLPPPLRRAGGTMGAFSTKAIRWVFETSRSHKQGNACLSQTPVVVVVVVMNWQGEPSMAKNSSPSRAPKTGAQLRDNRRSAKKCAKNPTHRRHNQKCGKRRTRLCCTTGMSTQTGDELNLRHFNCEQQPCR